jgi:hypothetical protein
LEKQLEINVTYFVTNMDTKTPYSESRVLDKLGISQSNPHLMYNDDDDDNKYKNNYLLVLRVNSAATKANYRVSTIRQIGSK